MLHDVLHRVRQDRRTLTVFNHEGPNQVIDDIRRYLAVRNVEVVERRTEPPVPRGFAVLHDDGEMEEAGSISTLHDYISPNEWDDVFDLEADKRPEPPALFRKTNDGVHMVAAGNKLPLIRASHQIEHLATVDSGGRLLSGFQRLSTLGGDPGTLRRYREIARCGTEVHVFGAPDADLPSVDGLAVHGTDAPEIRRMWFLAYLHDDRSGVLVAEAVDDESPPADREVLFDGFFSFRRELTEEVADYLVETYLDGTATT